jgi:hypothetical protein
MDAIGFDVLLQPDVPQRIRVRVTVRQVGTIPEIGIDEKNLRADLEGAADGLGERVGGFHRHVDASIVVGGIGIYEDGNLGEAANGPEIIRFEARGQFDGDHLRAFREDSAPHLERKLHPSWDHGQVMQITAA